MNTQHDPPWAQAADPSAMGLDIHNLVDDDFADILNSDLFSTDLTDFNGLESTASTAQHPFGNALVQLSGHDGTKQPSGVLADVSEPIVTTTGSQEPAKTSVDPHEVFARNQYVHHGFVDLPQADHRLENGMLRTLPTPNSSEVYGKSLEYNSYPHMEPQQEQQGVQQRWPWSHTDVNMYTPFESPAVDGAQSAVSYVPDYVPQGSLGLSPITSPAMNPQWHAVQTPRSAPRTAEGSVDESPGRERLEAEEEAEVQQAEGRPRKSRKKAAAASGTKSNGAGPRTRKNAASNASRKNSLSVHIPTRGGRGDGSTRIQSGQAKIEPISQLSAAHSNKSTSSSISPRPPDEASMAPPPRPASTSSTPTQRLAQASDALAETANPATPASLMKARTPSRVLNGKTGAATAAPGSQPSACTSPGTSGLEFLSLPEPAAPDSNGSGNTISRGQRSNLVGKQPARGGSSSTQNEVPRPGSAVQSPAEPIGMSKSESHEARSKKRNSSGSNLISPALRPKMSPSIKPLLPEGGGMDSQTQALLLASRSNYENILSGSHLPGVSYPADLGANLTSKRTSHKLAEQGRRNRINDALKEMQTLLPPKFASKVREAEAGGSGSSNQGSSKTNIAIQSGNSKAATVENAIEYIKVLQQEMSSLRDENAGLKAKNSSS